MQRLTTLTLPFVIAALPLVAGQSKTLSELVNEAPEIRAGRVVSATGYVGPDGETYTDVTFLPEAVLKSARKTMQAEMRFTVKGGVVGDMGVLFSDVPQFETGENVILFSSEGAPIEKVTLTKTRGLDVLARVLELRAESGEEVDQLEADRARQFLRRVPEEPGRGGAEPIDFNATVCAAYMGLKWPSTGTTWVNGANLPAAWLTSVQNAAAAWNSAGSKFVFTKSASSPHTLSMADLGSTGILAQTRVSYSTTTRTIVSFTMTFNTRFTWSVTGEAGKFDVQAITTHELGHALGLTHPPDATCSEQTMWASAGSGETKKRTLETGDKEGTVTLYGALTSSPPPPPPTAPAVTVTNFAVVASQAVSTKPTTLLFQGSGFDPASLQALFTGGACGTTGCTSAAFASSGVNAVFVNSIPAGSYQVAVRNGATGTLSAKFNFTVN